METQERIRSLRKNHLKMSMKTFGERLGVSRDTINNIENNRLANPEKKLSLYKLICKEFGISEEWLLEGKGDMYANQDGEIDSVIDQIMNGENEFAKNVFKTFAAFDQSDWEALEHMIDIYQSVSDPVPGYDDIPDDPDEFEKMFPPIGSVADDKSDAG